MARQPGAVTGLLLTGLCLAALPALTACGPRQADSGAAPQPAALRPVPHTGLHAVVLTRQAENLLGVRTTPVAAAPGGGAEIPVSAVIYDPQGAAWTYTAYSPGGPRSYLRRAITVRAVDGGTALLGSGPPVGTPVVVVAAPELLGTELGVGEE